MKELQTAWKEFQQMQERKLVCLDEMHLLSLIKIEDGIASFWMISALETDEPPCEKNITPSYSWRKRTISDLTSEQLRMVNESGIVFFYRNKILLADPLLLKSFVDLFGISGKALEPSLWRDVLLAKLFKSKFQAIASYRMCEGRKTLVSLHERDLNAGVNIYELCKECVRTLGATVGECKYDLTKFQAELLLPRKEEEEWRKVLIIRDDSVGRESLTVTVGYRKGDSLVFVNEIKKNHRSKIELSRMMSDIHELDAKTRFSAPSVDAEKVVSCVKRSLGQKRTQDFKNYLCRCGTSGQLYETAASFALGQLPLAQEIDFRFSLGKLGVC